MQIRQGNRRAALRGIDAFIDEHADVLPSVANAGVRTRLKVQIDGIERSGEVQDNHAGVARGLVGKQAELRQVVLAEHMRAISRVALADLPHTVELRALRMPHPSITNEQLIQAAEGMAATATPFADVFTAAGLPSDFATRLRDAATNLKRAIDSRTASRGKRHGATKGIATQLTNAARTVGILDALIRKDLRQNAELLADWEIVKTPAAKPGRPAGQESTPTPTTPAPTPASTAA